MLSGARQDLWLAVRSLARRPGFSAAAIATLALGIGASTAIFSVAFGVSLRPLHYAAPDRLIRVYEANPSELLARVRRCTCSSRGRSCRRAGRDCW